MRVRRPCRRVACVAAVAGLATIARVAAADCRTGTDLGTLAHSIAGAFRCERARLAGRPITCRATPPPACAETLVDDLLALAGTTGLTLTDDDRHRLAPG